MPQFAGDVSGAFRDFSLDSITTSLLDNYTCRRKLMTLDEVVSKEVSPTKFEKFGTMRFSTRDAQDREARIPRKE